MLQRAIEERWPIPQDMKKAMILMQMKDAIDKTASARERRAAAKVVLAAERQNQLDELASQPTTHVHAVIPVQITEQNLDDARAAILQEFDRVCGDG
jgi:hypothetical protein